MLKASATYKIWKIDIEENESVTVYVNGEKCANSKEALRTISKEISFKYDNNWNTQFFGKKLVEKLNYDEKYIKSCFVEICKEYFIKNTDEAHFTNDNKIDEKINNITLYPHLFVLSCLMDRQIKAERAWSIPYFIHHDLCNNNFEFKSLLNLSESDITIYFEQNKLHRYNSTMAEIFYKAICNIRDCYNGDASLIWSGNLSSAEVIYRFLGFYGCGIKIASMAANLLHRIFGIKYSDYSALDISPDIHVCRVMYRIGFIDNINDKEQVVYKAKDINPSYPGLLDKCCWEIGRNYCHSSTPECEICPLNAICNHKY